MSAPLTKLRPYQIAAREETRQAMREGVRRILTVAPTGAGKTVYGASILFDARQRGKRSIFVAHRRELISQSYDKVCEAGVPEEDVGIIQAGAKPRPNAPIQICSVDTLRARGLVPPADLVMPDEAHRTLSSTYQWLLEQYPRSFIIGLTATPQRTDGRGMKDAYDRIVLVSKPSELIAQGFLVNPRIVTHPMAADMSGVHMVGGEFNAAEVEQRVNKPKLLGAIVDHWLEEAAGRQTIAFAVSVKHSKDLAKEFCDRGIAAEHIDGSMDSVDRDAVLKRFKNGQTTIVVNVDVLVEGWDAPYAKVLISARPTMSLVRWLQMCGRIMRPYEGIGALILDHAGNTLRHGKPSWDRPWTLEGKQKKPREAQEQVLGVKVCPKCRTIVDSDVTECDPPCDYQWITPALEVAEGKLVELDDAAEATLMETLHRKSTRQSRLALTPALKRDYEQMLRAAAFNDRSAESAAEQFRAKHGAFPLGARLVEERFFPGGRSMFGGQD